MDWVAIVKDLGFPIAVCLYLMISMNKQFKMYTEMVSKANTSINSIKEVLVDLTGQSSYMISAMVNYRTGNQQVGDTMAKQAVYIGEQIQEKAKATGVKLGTGGDTNG